MTNSTLRALPQPEVKSTDPLTDLLRAGARCDLSVGCSLGAFPENWRRQPNQSSEVPQ
ncbi:hypothetical protein AERO9A_530010 [Aeromonas salmonicida]|nr:hypothetical protein AERO9A_530010 [Aeromonas salmonicida]